VLKRLTELGLLRRLEGRAVGGLHAGSASFIYTTTAAGQRLLDEPGARPRRHEPSLPFVAHTLAIADLYVELHRLAADPEGEAELLDIQTEPDCWRSWTGLGGERLLLRPDLYVAVGVGADEVRHFVEVDLGSEHRPALVRKALAYQRYYDSGVEEARDGVFPRVAWVVPDARRAEHLTSALTTTPTLAAQLFTVVLAEEATTALTT
jgi:hypothetical protein